MEEKDFKQRDTGGAKTCPKCGIGTSPRVFCKDPKCPFPVKPQKMAPIDQAAAMYAKEQCGRTLGDDLAAFFRVGYVFSTPTCFIMGKPVPSPQVALDVNGLEDKYADPWHDFTKDGCQLDTWLIWLAAGDLGEFFDHEPHRGDPKLYVAWARKGKLRWHLYSRTLTVCKSISTPPAIIAPHTFRRFVSA